MGKVIEIKNLSKSFGEVRAVQNVSFEVEAGSLFAFLGVNGAGKSTTISMMCGQLASDGGEVFIDGKRLSEHPDEIKRALGVVFQGSVLDKPLTVKENLANRAALYGIYGEELDKRLTELSALLGMEEILKRPYGKLSGGQRRKADIARALIHRPKILILDEPTASLDPIAEDAIYRQYNKLTSGCTSVFISHRLSSTRFCDRIFLLDEGHIAEEGSHEELIKLSGRYAELFSLQSSYYQKESSAHE